MNKETKEIAEVPLETLPDVAETFQPLADGDRFQSIIRLAQRTDELGQAIDKIRRFVLARALPGDWVKFGQKDKPSYLELTGAGAFRIASVLGISWTNWKSWKEQGTDVKGEWFTWWYQCDTRFEGRVIEFVQGRAGSRDKFFGYTNEAGWKELSDVKETDIQVAARRNAMKEGVKLMLGLLHIPEEAAASLGLPTQVIRGHSFGDKAKSSQSETKETPAGDAQKTQKIVIFVKEVTVKTGKTGNTTWNLFSVISDKDARYTTFDSNFAQTAKDAKANGNQVEIEFVMGQYGPEIKAIKSATNDGAAQ